jgi:hypothetical protein
MATLSHLCLPAFMGLERWKINVESLLKKFLRVNVIKLIVKSSVYIYSSAVLTEIHAS